jgi:hypothetical protein
MRDDRGLDALADAIFANSDAFYSELFARLAAADVASGAARAVEARALRRVRVAALLDVYSEREIAGRIGVSVRTIEGDLAALRALFPEHERGRELGRVA